MNITYFMIFSLFALIVIPLNAYADETVTSYSLDETTLIEIQNNSDEDIYSIRMWGGEGFNFESYNTEKGWFGQLNTAGVLIFKSPTPIQSGESVKFGVKTNISNPGINWKILDEDENQIEAGKVLSSQMPDFTKISNQEVTLPDDIPVSTVGINSDSTFRLVPEKPNIGSLFRVTGDSFGASQEFDFYIDNTKVGSFVTDKDGHFITTMKISEDQNAGRVDFMIKDKEDNNKTMSIRIEKIEKNIIRSSDDIKLTIKGIPSTVHTGEVLEISGTGNPSNVITLVVTNENGNSYSNKIAEIDKRGNWELEESFIISTNYLLGKYTITITDGRQSIEKEVTVKSDKVILLSPNTLKFEIGELMTFEGTVLPDIPLEITIEDPLHKEIFSDIFQIDGTGAAKFEYDLEPTSIKGTYTIIATQDQIREFIFVGVGQLPTTPIFIEFDKLNYKAGEIAEISLIGVASDNLSLLIIRPSEQTRGNPIPITLHADGRAMYPLDLDGYESGVYTVVVSKGTTKNYEFFSVGLQTGSGEIKINTTKEEYMPGDSILILGETDENILLTITLSDSNGNKIKEKEIFSDKIGKISESSFNIPHDGEFGTWLFHIKSGSNFYTKEITVISSLDNGMVISVEDGIDVTGIGKTKTIRIIGAQSTVEFQIQSANGNVIELFSTAPSSQGEINQPWIIPTDTVPGIYTIIADDSFDTVETTFEIE